MSIEGKLCSVYGATGYIGSKLYDRLEDLGARQYYRLKRIPPLAAIHYDIRERFAVFNCSGLADIKKCLLNPIEAYESNVMSVVNLLEACRIGNVNRIVLSSSNIVLGKNTPYKSTMEACEKMAQTYIESYGAPIICLRFANVYGVGSRRVQTVVESFAKQKQKHGKIVVMGDGSQTRDFIHINDVVEAMIKAAESDYCGVLDICTGVQTTIKELAEMFDCPVEYVNGRENDAQAMIQSPSEAIDKIGWKSKITLKEGISDVLRYM